MHAVIFAALCATTGFAIGDTLTALLARRVGGRASMLLLTVLKVVLYVPLAVLWRHEFGAFDTQTLAWSALLAVLFTVAYVGFNMALEVSASPALVGVVAGCFPASASFVAIVFLGQRPTLLTVILLFTVLTGVVLIGLPQHWRTSLKMDAGILLALLPLVGWGVYGALLNEPVRHLGTPHAWFVVQSVVALLMALFVAGLYNRHMPQMVQRTTKRGAWRLALVASLVLGTAELVQTFALGSGRQLVIVETLLGSYPAVYFWIAHRLFHEPLERRQWAGIAVVVVSIMLLSTGA